MKGVSLPVNAIVIITLAIIVLLAVATWFGIQMMRGGSTIECESAWADACPKWKNVGCNESYLREKVNSDKFPTIRDACLCKYGNIETCKKACCG